MRFLIDNALSPVVAERLEASRARRRACSRLRATGIDALLAEGDVEEAWSVANEDPDWEPGLAQRVSLAEAREPQHSEQALPWYMLAADEMLIETGRRAYARTVPVLKNARRAAAAAGQSEWFTARVAELREQHRRRPTLIAMLDKAGIG